jgi:hypothetical protein
MRSDLWVFYRLPKTAGGTLARSIAASPNVTWLPGDQEAYGPERLPVPQPGMMIWRGGHVSYGLHVVYDAVPRYCTVLREPIDRLISEFFYAHAQANLFLPEGERRDAFCRYVEAASHLNY